eukprot:CAMPEP_0116901714 /NCGR_PEP_ID=MMETSP0467-20121206/9543_1 /TAXON_ID=283647 /ORGANISM="Mesodinium pulex, Strain SPMC105" /LENGTH=43 /DNA_ID= /DNA_START= /DNA_END= /DNA_ORIENTATION=
MNPWLRSGHTIIAGPGFRTGRLCDSAASAMCTGPEAQGPRPGT